MPLLKQNKIFKRLKVLLLIPTALLTLSSCASFVHLPENVSDIEWCHPFKDQQGHDIGASCDMFLTSNPKLLGETQWKDLQDKWLADNGVVECTSSKSMINLKIFVEDTCSQITCDEKTKAKLLESLQRIALLGTQ